MRFLFPRKMNLETLYNPIENCIQRKNLLLIHQHQNYVSEVPIVLGMTEGIIHQEKIRGLETLLEDLNGLLSWLITWLIYICQTHK